MQKIRAVNLGGWFVLERWMKPSLFEASTSAKHCETSFVLHHPDPLTALQAHWESWVTMEDLQWIKTQGINLVRIPIPWWLFPDKFSQPYPYHSPLRYLDKAMDMAKQAGLQVMLDLHTAPGSQNGFDNGGEEGVLTWHTDSKNIDKTIAVLEEIAKRYALHPAMHSLQVLNEPHWTIDIAILKDFYQRCYAALRPLLRKETFLVFHDGFRFKEWFSFFQNTVWDHVILDTHLYQCFDAKFAKMEYAEFLNHAAKTVAEYKAMEEYVPVVVGEWSLGARDMPLPVTRDEFERAYFNAQIQAYEQLSGWIFWAYKITNHHSGWNFRSLVERGIAKL